MAKKRKRRTQRAAPSQATPSPAPSPRRRKPDDRPPAPWGSFPLVELVILVALVLLVWGFLAGNRTMVVTGLVLASVGGLEISIREHFAGYRSHTLLLAGAAGTGVIVLLAFGVPSLWLPAALGIALAVGLAAATWLSRAFRRRTGVAFRVKPRRR